jgi:hypothetical protein
MEAETRKAKQQITALTGSIKTIDARVAKN